MRHAAMVFVLSLATTAFAQQRDFSNVAVTATKVAGTVYMLTGAGGNIGVTAGEDGIVIVDDQYAPLVPKIKEALRGISDKPIRFVLNTHYHGDHTGGNEAFGRDRVPIVAHANVRKRMETGARVLGNAVPPAPKEALPIVTFDDKVSIHVNGEEVRAIHFPHGHTDGDAVIFFTKSNVVHMGDDFFHGLFPFVDLDNGGSVKGLIANIDKVLSLVPDDVKVIPGHGPLTDKAGLRAFATMLKETRAVVAKAVKEKKTLEQMKQQKVLAKWDALGKIFITTDSWTETLYRELTSTKK